MQDIPFKSGHPRAPTQPVPMEESLRRAAPASAAPNKLDAIKVALGLKRLRNAVSGDLAIDLGTSNTLICKRDRQIILNEPSVLAVLEYKGKKKIEAVGEAAKRMLGRTPGNITAIRPLKDGVIADFRATENMLQHFIRKIHHMRFLRPGPRVLICVPGKSTEVERRAIVESAMNSGARKVWLMEEPMAAAIGAGIEVEQASGAMVVDIGGGTTEIAIISLSGLVYCDSLRIGGDSFDEAITNYVRRHRGSVIGSSTAERIKIQIGCACAGSEIREISVPGRNLERGVPYSFPLNSGEVLKAIQDPLAAVVQAVRIALEQSPPELASDIAERGITITGGGALLRGLDRLLMDGTGLPVYIAEDPLTCVVRGGGMALEMDILRRLSSSEYW